MLHSKTKTASSIGFRILTIARSTRLAYLGAPPFRPPTRTSATTSAAITISTTPGVTQRRFSHVTPQTGRRRGGGGTTPRELKSHPRVSPAAMGAPTDITLYTSATPNGIKVSILLEELGLDYKVKFIDLTENEQKEPWFLSINPNGRIPAITDKLPDGTTINVFESGAVMEYLVERYDAEHKASYPRGSKEHYEVLSWLHWQMGGLGPMQGQSNHFKRYAPVKIEYGISRYGNETRRLYRVLEAQLARSRAQGHDFIVGDRVTIADIASWAWIASHTWAGIPLTDYPHINAWLLGLLARPAFERGRHVPKPHTAFDNDLLTEEQLDEKAARLGGWVQRSMADDARAAAGKA